MSFPKKAEDMTINCPVCNFVLDKSRKYSNKLTISFDQFEEDIIQIFINCSECGEFIYQLNDEEQNKANLEAEIRLAIKLEVYNEELIKELSPGSQLIIRNAKLIDIESKSDRSQHLMLQKMVSILDIEEIEELLHCPASYSSMKRME